MDAEFFCRHSELCKVLANDKRQMIIGALREHELSVNQLVEATGVSQSNMSQHLSRMRAYGVLNVRRSGTQSFYSIANPKLLQAFDLITEVLRESAVERSWTAAPPVKEDTQR